MWWTQLGPDRFVRLFSTGSLAARLLDPDFQATLEMWWTRLGPDRFVRLFSTGSLAARLLDPAFQAMLEMWWTRLGPDRFVPFAVCHAVNLLNEDFQVSWMFGTAT